ncbi:hypothetical protein GSI_05354 [Ganoderma sinense ZZ0214-1]|uniref:Mid2 domain-containing protein n=1 Tax=Ganoderma sinense ZZ0214-1 TaxID=1077348 RepID=A0A2G8SFU7_9APHY|nr:hypothetical protein GSI_05354 [Ganoderma sinense ZZ0214-1]
MDSLGRILAFFFFSSLLVQTCRADHTFNWGLGPDSNFIQQTFSECDNVQVRLIPLQNSTTLNSTGPYYMFAYAPEGMTMVSHIGDKPGSLQWQVQNPKGSKLLLTVVDGNNNTGGFAGSYFNVVAGNTSCQPPTPNNPPVVHANVSTTINTCDPWGLTITGGVMPYTVSLAALSSPVVTNVSLGPGNDVLTFIDRADPGTQLLAAVVDATGQWGISSVAVHTAGAAVVPGDCPGLNTNSATTAQVQAQAAAAAGAAAQAAKAKNTAIVLGVVFGLVVPLILAGVAFWYWRRRKGLMSRGVVDGQDARPRPYDPASPERALERPSLSLDTRMVQISSQPQRTQSWVVDVNSHSSNRRTDSPTSFDMASTEIGGAASMPIPYLTSPAVQSSAASMIRSPQSQFPVLAVSRAASIARTLVPPESALLTPNSTSPAATLTPSQRYRKMLEAHMEAQAARARGSGSGFGSGPPSIAGSSIRIAGPSSRTPVQRSQSAGPPRSFPAQTARRANTSLRLPPVAAIPESDPSVGPDIIIQHRDGGIVEELPPPYPVDSRYPGPAEPGSSTMMMPLGEPESPPLAGLSGSGGR